MVFAASSSRFRDTCGLIISASCMRGSISLTLLQPKKLCRLLMIHKKLHQLIASKMEEVVLKVIDAAASINLWEEAKQAMKVLSKTMNSASYIYDTVFCDL